MGVTKFLLKKGRIDGWRGSRDVRKQLRFAKPDEPKAKAEMVAKEKCGGRKELSKKLARERG
jgi:hypothetical protein